MWLHRVTLTGADDSTDPKRLIELWERFDFVEWGILLSASQEGTGRFPSLSWLMELARLQRDYGYKLPLSGHLCGRWVRDWVIEGRNTFEIERAGVYSCLKRIQLNFHGYRQYISTEIFPKCLVGSPSKQIILQCDGTNDYLVHTAAAYMTIGGVAALFDQSGGAGVVPSVWPKPLPVYCGYAGGLSPGNVVEQIKLIRDVVDEAPFWIDAETHLRTDGKFDLDKCVRFLAAIEPYVKLER